MAPMSVSRQDPTLKLFPNRIIDTIWIVTQCDGWHLAIECGQGSRGRKARAPKVFQTEKAQTFNISKLIAQHNDSTVLQPQSEFVSDIDL